jgi:DNA-binding transcriptional ArsR family regulator
LVLDSTVHHGYVFGMSYAIDLATVAALLGDPARANILAVLQDGRAQTATELAYAAGVSPQTTSGHLAKLTDARLLSLQKQGRHRYYRLASPLVGRMLEAVMAVAAVGPPRHRPESKLDEALRSGRTCYDHLAGRLGVALADALVAQRCIVLAEDGGEVTRKGSKVLTEFGIDLAAAGQRRRTFCRPCLDWSERRPHIAGSIGAALASRSFELGWLARLRDSRAVSLTPRGRSGFKETFGLTLP